MAKSTTHSRPSRAAYILLATLASRILISALALLASYLPLFDSSPYLLLPNPNTDPGGGLISRWTSTLLRWDAFHFAHVAQHGYVYEYEWAFFPGIALVMRYAGKLLRSVKPSTAGGPTLEDVLQGGAIAAFLCDMATPVTLYSLTLELLHSERLAFTTAMLSLLPSSPATLRHAPYTEPFFTFLSYRGMLHISRREYVGAAINFTLAGLFRSNGFLLSGFIVWDMLIRPFMLGKHNLPRLRTIATTTVLAALPFAPFVGHQYIAYKIFCTSDPRIWPVFQLLLPTGDRDAAGPPNAPDSIPSPPTPSSSPSAASPFTPAPWCSNTPPSIYSYVQGHYWNSGLLLYWTPAQIPNFLIAAPVLALLVSFSLWHLRSALLPRIRPRSGSVQVHLPQGDATSSEKATSPFLSPLLTPHAMHALALSAILLFASHVQIALRLAASMPLTYWAAAWLITERPGNRDWGRMWITWSACWGALSVVLWVAFLPPA